MLLNFFKIKLCRIKMFFIYLLISLSICSYSLVQSEPYCDINLIPADPVKLKIPPIVATDAHTFEAFYEVIDSTSRFTEIIREVFIDELKLVVAVQTIDGYTIKTYSFYKNNALKVVTDFGQKNPKCKILDLKDNIGLTPFELAEVKGEEVPVSPLSKLFHDQNIKFVYTGNSNKVRGIPVNEWKTCIHDSDSEYDTKVTYSFSDPEKWVPAANLKGFESIPIQILYESQNKKTKNVTTKTYSISDFRPFADAREEFYASPSGLYCTIDENAHINPVQIKFPVPFNSFSYLLTVASWYDDMQISGFVTNSLVEYNYDLNLYYYQRSEQNEVIDELHDFTTGISYSINEKKRNMYHISYQ